MSWQGSPAKGLHRRRPDEIQFRNGRHAWVGCATRTVASEGGPAVCILAAGLHLSRRVSSVLPPARASRECPRYQIKPRQPARGSNTTLSLGGGHFVRFQSPRSPEVRVVSSGARAADGRVRVPNNIRSLRGSTWVRVPRYISRLHRTSRCASAGEAHIFATTSSIRVLSAEPKELMSRSRS
jgi:hypothetical protein